MIRLHVLSVNTQLGFSNVLAVDILVVSTPEYLNPFRSGLTSISMICRTVKNDFDTEPFHRDGKTVRGVVSIRV